MLFVLGKVLQQWAISAKDRPPATTPASPSRGWLHSNSIYRTGSQNARIDLHAVFAKIPAHSHLGCGVQMHNIV